jgi:hypothetical protein
MQGGNRIGHRGRETRRKAAKKSESGFVPPWRRVEERSFAALRGCEEIAKRRFFVSELNVFSVAFCEKQKNHSLSG